MKSRWLPIIGMLVLATATARVARAEARFVSWNPVTTYTDGATIEAGTTVMYTVCWSNDPWFASGIRTLKSSTTATSVSFDPVAEGMSDFGEVYFSVKTVLSTGEESTFSGVYPWNPPLSAATAGIPLAPANLGIARISMATPSGTWEVSWDPVTKDTNGGTIDRNAVRYTLYWTTDAGLSADSLVPLASSIVETSFAFSPDAAGMGINQRVYFAARTVLTTGEKSALSSSLSWKTLNKGLSAPSNGRMKNRK